jgi:hypothetical protein
MEAGVVYVDGELVEDDLNRGQRITSSRAGVRELTEVIIVTKTDFTGSLWYQLSRADKRRYAGILAAILGIEILQAAR